MNLSNKTLRIWDKAQPCHCGAIQDEYSEHKLCGICGKKMIFNAHASNESQKGSKGGWNIDHIKPKWKGGSDKIENLQAVHVQCNFKKDN